MASHRVKIRITNDGRFITPWGEIEHSNPRPERNEVGPLMLITPDYRDQILAAGSLNSPTSRAVHSIERKGDKWFARLDYYGKHWRWELFDAYFDDGQGPDILLGVWPRWRRALG